MELTDAGDVAKVLQLGGGKLSPDNNPEPPGSMENPASPPGQEH